MKTTIKNRVFKTLSIGIIISGFAVACSGGEDKASKYQITAPQEEVAKVERDKLEFASESFEAGREVYIAVCQACHQANGNGIVGVFPPLAQSDYLLADIDRAIHITANGLNKEIVVNGVTYSQMMPKPEPELTDEQVANVLTFVLNSWGNDEGGVTVEQVAIARK